jgi:hypothetical protein
MINTLPSLTGLPSKRRPAGLNIKRRNNQNTSSRLVYRLGKGKGEGRRGVGSSMSMLSSSPREQKDSCPG